jgi:hypothetical protein
VAEQAAAVRFRIADETLSVRLPNQLAVEVQRDAFLPVKGFERRARF